MNYIIGDFIKEVVVGESIWHSVITNLTDDGCSALVFSGPISRYVGIVVTYSYDYCAYNRTSRYIEIISKENNPDKFEACQKLLHNYYKMQVFK